MDMVGSEVSALVGCWVFTALPKWRPAAHQYTGKGDFLPVHIELNADGQLTLKDSRGQLPTIFSVVGAKLQKPKSKRNGHPNSFRLDMSADVGSQLQQKFIFSWPHLTRWTNGLRP